MIGIIADIHGNYPALRAVMDELKAEKCDEIYCLGDIVGYYCMVNECIEILRDNKVHCIKGNHESYLLGESICPRSNTVNRCIQFQKEKIKEKNLKWIKELPLMITENKLCGVHGGWDDFLDEYIVEFDFESDRVKHIKAELFMSGHTHKPKVQMKDKVIYCNPGSVGQPRDYNPQASYGVFDGRHIKLLRCDYDINLIKAEMFNAGFSEYFYNNLEFGCKIGEQI